MSVLLILLASFVCGALVTMQASVNAELARTISSSYVAVAISLLVSLLLILPMAVAQLRQVRFDGLTAAPWWIWIGGSAGAALVSCGLLFVPRVGVALFFAMVIAGQLASAAAIDHFGWFGTAVRSIDAPRLAGLGLVLAGVLVFRFVGR